VIQDVERRPSGRVVPAEQLTADRVGQSHRRLVVARVAQRTDLLQLGTTGIGPVGLQWVQQQHQLGDPGLQPRTQIGGCVRVSASRFVTSANEVHASARSRQTLV
jgi:hypothetical protein